MLARARDTWEGALCWWSINQWTPNPWHVLPSGSRLEDVWSGTLLSPPVPASYPPNALVSSLRWEALLDGGQDFEYQLLLEQRVSAAAALNSSAAAAAAAMGEAALARRAGLVTGWSMSHSVPYARNMSLVEEVRLESAEAIECLKLVLEQ